MKKAGLYIRVSTLEQAREGYSIGAQTERLEAYAKAKGYAVHDTYTDAGESGGKLDRPELQRLIRDIKNKRLDTVVVLKLDRLSRSQKDTLHLIQDVFKPNDVDFISVNESFDTSSSFGIAMIGILSVFAELERSTITERLEMGRVERAKAGYYHGGGNYDPLGYDYINGELIINEYEAEIVKELFELYVNGNSMNTTAMKLREKYPDRIKSFTIVKDALQKVLYIGKVQFNGEVYDGLHESIISEEVFHEAQKKRKERAKGTGWTNKRKGLLVGKIYCAHCGARYYREVTGSRKYRYVNYVCRSKDRRKANKNMIKDRNCKNKRWREEELDNLVLEQLKKIDYGEIEKDKPKLIDYASMVEQTDKEIERLVKLYASSKIDVTLLNKLSSELNTKRETLLQKQGEQEMNLEEDDNRVARSMIGFDWENADKNELMHTVDTLVDRIDIEDTTVTICYNF